MQVHSSIAVCASALYFTQEFIMAKLRNFIRYMRTVYYWRECFYKHYCDHVTTWVLLRVWRTLYWWSCGGKMADDIYSPRKWYCPPMPAWAVTIFDKLDISEYTDY